MNTSFSPSLPSPILNRPRRASSDESEGSSSETEDSPFSRCPKLTELSLRALDLRRLPPGDQCLAKSLNNMSQEKMGQDRVRQLVPEWLSSLPKNVVERLTAEFFNYLSEDQIRAFTPEQISWIAIEVLKNLHVFSSFTPWQVQSLTQEQIRNIFITQPRIHKYFGSKQHLLLTYLTLKQLSGLTNNQINFILELLVNSMYSWSFHEEVTKTLSFQMPRLFRILNREQVESLTETALHAMARFGEDNFLRGIGGRVSQWFTERQRELLTPRQRTILDENVKTWRIVENWTPAKIAQMETEQFLALPSRVFASLNPEQIAAISPQVIAALDENFWRNLMNNLHAVEREHILRSLTKDQVAKMPDGVLRSLPLIHLSPDAMSIVPAIVLHDTLRTVWFHSAWITLTPAHVAAWTPQQTDAMSSSLFPLFGDDLPYMLNNVLKLEAFQALQGNFFDWLESYQPDFIRALTRERLQNILPTIISQISHPNFFKVLIKSGQAGWLTPQQIAAISPHVLENMKTGFWLALLPLEQVNGKLKLKVLLTPEERTRCIEILKLLTPAQVRSIPLNIWQMLTEEFLQGLHPESLAAVPPWAFAQQTAGFTASFNDLQLAALTAEQVSNLSETAFVALQIEKLNPNVFQKVTAKQLCELLNRDQIYRITGTQLPVIPVRTLHAMSSEEATAFYRSLTEEQRNALTPAQRAFFEDLMAGVPTERTGNGDRPPTPPPPSAGGREQGGSAGGAGEASGGARQQPLAWIQSKFLQAAKGSKERGRLAPFMPREEIKKTTSAFWNDDNGPELTTSLVSSGSNSATFQFTATTDGLKNWKGVVRQFRRDQVSLISPKTCSGMNAATVRAFSPLQLMVYMTPEQRNEIKVACLKLNDPLKRILNITKDRLVTPAEYMALVKGTDKKRLRDICTPELLEKLKNDEDSYLLYCLGPEFFFGEGDWGPNRIAAIPEEIITKAWTAKHFNQLSPYQLLAIKSEYFEKLSREVIAGLQRKYFEIPPPLANNNEYQQGYRERIRALGSKVQFIAPEVISVLGPKVFGDYMRPDPFEHWRNPDQFLMLRREQRQAISFERFSADFFCDLAQRVQTYSGREKLLELVRDFTEEQTRSLIDLLATTFREKRTSSLSRVGFVCLLNAFQPWQVRMVSKELLDALTPHSMSFSFTDLDINFLNAMSAEQIRGRPPVQMEGLNRQALPLLEESFLKNLTALQCREFSEDMITALGSKIKSLNPENLKDEKVAANIFSNATGDQLRLLSEAQIDNVDVPKIAPSIFGKACRKGGVAFFKKFSLRQIDRLTLAQQKAIPIKIYGELIIQIYNKMTDDEIKQYAINIPPAAFLVALAAWKEGLESNEMSLSDEQRLAILKGTFRIKMERDAPEQTTPPTITFSGGQIGCGSNQGGYVLEPPIRSPQVEPRMPTRVVELRA